jgi:hypothetical protein
MPEVGTRMKCAPGICVHCETEIATKCSDCGNSYKPNEHYTTVEMPWTNGSRMTIPVCIPCSKGPVWVCDKKALTQAVWDQWDKQGGKYDKEVVIA